MWYMYTHTIEYYSPFEKEEILSFATWINLEDIILSGLSQAQKVIYDLLYGNQKKVRLNRSRK